MTTIYNRYATLTIIKENQKAKIIKGLRVSFDIEKNSGSNPNKSKISVYNLSPDSRALVQDGKIKLILEVGYLGINKEQPIGGNIFQGDIERTITTKNGPDIITVFEVGDESEAIVKTVLDKSYEKNVSIKSVVLDAVKSLKVVFSQTEIDKLSDKKYISGISIDGKASKTLDNIISSEGFTWSIQDGVFKITKSTEKNINTAVLFNKDTGLLDIPSITKLSSGESGIQFNAFIDTRVKPGITAKVQSDILKIDGFYKVERVVYKGDTRSPEWKMTVEAV